MEGGGLAAEGSPREFEGAWGGTLQGHRLADYRVSFRQALSSAVIRQPYQERNKDLLRHRETKHSYNVKHIFRTQRLLQRFDISYFSFQLYSGSQKSRTYRS